MSRVKKQDHENLTISNIQRVIELLNPEEGKAITKKVACEILNISYNTKRLTSIIESHIERQAYVVKRRKDNRGKPATKQEKADAITSYLQGDAVSDIAKQLYRPPPFIKGLLEEVGVPQRPVSTEDKMHVDFIPDKCVSEIFNPGEIVWSARYHTTAIVGAEVSVAYQETKKGLSGLDYEEKYSSKCYQIHVIEKTESPGVGGFSAFSLAYDLAKLKHLEEFGVDLERI